MLKHMETFPSILHFYGDGTFCLAVLKFNQLSVCTQNGKIGVAGFSLQDHTLKSWTAACRELNKKTSVYLPVNPYYITVIQKNNEREPLFLRRRYKTTLQIALSQSRVTLSLGRI